MRLTPKQRENLEKATATYQEDVAAAKDYLLARGIDGKTAAAARLGVVVRPLPGHETYAGRLAIPYLTPAGVVDIRFRCIENHACKDQGHGKYLSMPGHKTRLYNTPAILTAEDTIAITEGELDALILTYRTGIPAVGVAGAQAWQGFYSRIFQDFANVLVFGDGDNAGKDFARQVARDLEGATTIDIPAGMDVTDLFLAEGGDGLLYRAGLLDLPDDDDLNATSTSEEADL